MQARRSEDRFSISGFKSNGEPAREDPSGLKRALEILPMSPCRRYARSRVVQSDEVCLSMTDRQGVVWQGASVGLQTIRSFTHL